MTTIAYDYANKKISVESRLSEETRIITDNDTKFIIIDGVTYLTSGLTSDVEIMVNFIEGKEVKFDHDLECSLFEIKDGDVYQHSYYQNRFIRERLDFNYTYGSGSAFAKAALDLGLSSEQAVELAIKNDIYSGGKIHTFEV